MAGDTFGSYLNHKGSLKDPTDNSVDSLLRRDYLNYMVNTIFKQCYETLIENVKKISLDTHIISHGYGYTVPTGIGIKLVHGMVRIPWMGPWLKPALENKEITSGATQILLVNEVITTYNTMLKNLQEQHPKFHYVDFREIIHQFPYNNGIEDWVNELHLSPNAYRKCACQLHNVIEWINNNPK